MTLSPMVAELEAAYEQEHGQKPAEPVLKIAEHILNVGKMFKELGQKDAHAGKKPCPACVFPDLVRNAFHKIPEDATTKEIVDLWQSAYMDGYNNP